MSGLSMKISYKLGTLSLDVTLEHVPGHLAIIGPNGAGKTTLLRAIAGGLTPSKGYVRSHGETLFDSSESISLPPEERNVGYVPQGSGLFPHLSALENVMFALLSAPTPLHRRARKKRALDWMKRWNCGHLATKKSLALSGGERQRVALARATLAAPSLLLLDEPFSSLDQHARQEVHSLLLSALEENGSKVVLVTHDASAMKGLCDTVAVMNEGEVIQTGSLEELRNNPSSVFVGEFLGGRK